jgi:hypothetical protein
MFTPTLERIRSDMSKRVITRALAHARLHTHARTRALAHARSHAVLEHVNYVSHVTCGHL